MIEHTHRIRTIQVIINRVENIMTKIVEASGTKRRGASVVYILLFKGLVEWGLE
jgi:hypothetical protein